MLIGPGPSNYGDTCTECYVQGLTMSKKKVKHRLGCSRGVDNCKIDKHDICNLDKCECDCHLELKRSEIHKLRKLLRSVI